MILLKKYILCQFAKPNVRIFDALFKTALELIFLTRILTASTTLFANRKHGNCLPIGK